MGNMLGAPAPNQVDIMQCGACSGGCTCTFGPPWFEAEPMDQRLKPFLTEQEYKSVIEKANGVLRRKAPTWRGSLLWLPIILAGVAFFFFLKPGKYFCEAPNGECQRGQDPVADQCCRYTCCLKSDRERRLQEEPAFLGAAWGNASAPAEADGDAGSERALLSRRLAEDGVCEVTDMTEDTECLCRQQGKKKVCDGVIRIDGNYSVEEGRMWPLAPGIGLTSAGGTLPWLWVIYANCMLGSHIEPVLEPWRQKGLSYKYIMGSKHTQARIQVFTPQHARVVGGHGMGA